MRKKGMRNADVHIETTEALLDFLSQCSGTDVLAIDTEFIREKTYYPQLCLLQFATREHLALVDPLAPLDLGVLGPLLVNPAVTKVFHAGDQDRALIFQEMGLVASPVFDTQWASMLLGLPTQASLSTLVHRYRGIVLPKADSFSDWSARPLTTRQLEYAADDVRYLPGIYDLMREELELNGRLTWLQQDFEEMALQAAKLNEPEEMWSKVKHASALSSRQLASLREVAAWRERTAQARNLPRKWVLPDEALVEIARNDPEDLEALFRIRGLRNRLGQLWAREVLRALEAARALPDDAWPQRRRTKSRTTDTAAARELMNALVQLRARELHIAPSYLAPSSELKALIAGDEENLSLLSGWRLELIGHELKALLEGRLALWLSEGVLKVGSR
ncbi:MAG: ribonuclease D [Coriobacteriales bacterium]|jgi:ribonuclease D|nr:ribonuclease D [Coriobacteriales bacterium]